MTKHDQAQGANAFATGGQLPATMAGVDLTQEGSEATTTPSGRYTRLHKIGEGGMSTVWLCKDEVLQKLVAMKVAKPGLSSYLRSEFLTLSEITSAHVIRVFHYEETSNEAFYIMEYLEGETLEKTMQENGVQNFGTVCQWMQHIISGLQAAHNHNVIHRDIKPQNIILTPSGQLKLLDFGIAKNVEEDSNHTQHVGTVYYMAPEQISGEEATAATDVYLLGCLLYYLVTGRPPMMTAASAFNKNLPAGFDEFQQKMVAGVQAERPSLETLITQFEEFEAMLFPGMEVNAFGGKYKISKHLRSDDETDTYMVTKEDRLFIMTIAKKRRYNSRLESETQKSMFKTGHGHHKQRFFAIEHDRPMLGEEFSHEHTVTRVIEESSKMLKYELTTTQGEKQILHMPAKRFHTLDPTIAITTPGLIAFASHKGWDYFITAA